MPTWRSSSCGWRVRVGGNIRAAGGGGVVAPRGGRGGHPVPRGVCPPVGRGRRVPTTVGPLCVSDLEMEVFLGIHDAWVDPEESLVADTVEELPEVRTCTRARTIGSKVGP